jgi:uncharacterized RDD family membrane protein YckC
MIYAGFGKRFLANLTDALVFLPLGIAYLFLHYQSRNLALFFTVLSFVLSWAYTIVFHARWGQTLGKKAVNIRVIKVSGEPISWREAFLRSSVDMVLNTFYVVGTLIALLHFPESAFGQVARAEWNKHLAEFSPVWLSWVNILTQIWSWSELVVLLFNKKKRALHDFIAGTVVIHDQKAKVTLEQAAF